MESEGIGAELHSLTGKETSHRTVCGQITRLAHTDALISHQPKYVAQLQSQFHIMRTQQDCLVHIMCQTAQQAHGLYSGWIIEEGRGFIQQDERCLLCQSHL